MYWWPTGNGCLLLEHYGNDSLKALCGSCDFSWHACYCAQRTFTRMKVILPTYTFIIHMSLHIDLLANQHGRKWFKNYIRN